MPPVPIPTETEFPVSLAATTKGLFASVKVEYLTHKSCKRLSTLSQANKNLPSQLNGERWKGGSSIGPVHELGQQVR